METVKQRYPDWPLMAILWKIKGKASVIYNVSSSCSGELRAGDRSSARVSFSSPEPAGRRGVITLPAQPRRAFTYSAKWNGWVPMPNFPCHGVQKSPSSATTRSTSSVKTSCSISCWKTPVKHRSKRILANSRRSPKWLTDDFQPAGKGGDDWLTPFTAFLLRSPGPGWGRFQTLVSAMPCEIQNPLG